MFHDCANAGAGFAKKSWVHEYGAAAVMIILTFESLGLPIPGESVLVFASVLARRGELSLGNLAEMMKAHGISLAELDEVQVVALITKTGWIQKRRIYAASLYPVAKPAFAPYGQRDRFGQN